MFLSLSIDYLTDFTGLTQVACYTKDYFPHHTIRSTSCTVLLPVTGMRCAPCLEHRKSLNAMLHRHSKTTDDATKPADCTDPTSHTNYRFAFTVGPH